MRRPTLAPVVIVLAALLIPAGYMGAYYAMLSGTASISPYQKIGTPPGKADSYSKPIYRVDGLDALFLPAHFIDRIIRPDWWPEPYWGKDVP